MLPTKPDANPIFLQLDRNWQRPYSYKEYLTRTLWELVWFWLFRPSPRRAYAWRRWLLRMFGASVAQGAQVRNSTKIVHPWLLTLGGHATIGDRVRVYNLGPITIGSHTTISQDVHLCAGTHDHNDPAFPLIRSRIVVGSGVWIAADSFVGPDITVGDNCVVAARSVVYQDIPAGKIVGGNPAKIIADRKMPPST